MANARWPMSSFPRGWFVVAYSTELKEKEVLPLHYFGQELVLFRGEQGTAALLDAYCPHLGTHLGISSSVEGDTVRCPMHGWRFDTTGACVEVPYTDGVPRKAQVRRWPLRERSGLIWTFYDPHGGEPDWEPPEIPEYGDPDWTEFSAHENRWVIRSHAQIVQENACDIHHLRELHGFFDPEVEETVTDGPVLWSRFGHKRGYGEIGVGEAIDVRTSIGIYGIGLSKQNSVAAGVIRSSSLCTTTPIDEDRIDLRMASAVRRLDTDEATRTMHETVLATTKATIEEDIPVWETRNYRFTGFYKDDGALTTFRHWSRQFYTEQEGAP